MPWLLNRTLLTCSLFLWLGQVSVLGQSIQGQIFDAADNRIMEEVMVINIGTNKDKITDKQGRFAIDAQSGQLVEFRKEGYKVLRFRIPQGKLPPYFKVAMQKYDPAIPDFENKAAPDYKSDSIKYALLYKKELEFPQMTTLQVIEHPFSAMSKHNQQIWAFQKEYAANQQQKRIDYEFSDQRIYTLTGLTGDSLQIYKHMYRPTYSQLCSMNEYTFYNYIKRTVNIYRVRGLRSKQSPTRLSH